MRNMREDERIEMVADVRADLVARIGVDESAVRVVTVEAVTWRDGSLGCPEPGRSYTQALVPGVRIVLEVDGATYDYRGTHRGGFRLCTNAMDGEIPGLDPT